MGPAEPPPRQDADVTTPDGGATTGEHVDVGVLIAHSPEADTGDLRSFTERMATDAVGELETATDAEWRFHTEEFARLSDNDTRHLSEFLDRATHRMVEGPYDLTVIPRWTSSRGGMSEAIPSLRFAGERETRPVAFGPGIRSSATAATPVCTGNAEFGCRLPD